MVTLHISVPLLLALEEAGPDEGRARLPCECATAVAASPVLLPPAELTEADPAEEGVGSAPSRRCCIAAALCVCAAENGRLLHPIPRVHGYYWP